MSADPRALPGPQDPMEMVGVMMPASRADLVEMARCLVEEYAMLSYPANRILLFFQAPFYEGAHRLTHVLGLEEIRRIVGEVFGEGD